MAGSEQSGARSLLVLGKITEILDAFSLTRPTLTLGEIRAATGLPTSTVQRLVMNLVSHGFLDRQGDQVRIGVRMAYWAAPATRGVDTLDLVQPVLRDLRDTTGETACFFRAEQGHRVCVALAETHHAIRREMHVGKILPLHAGSASRVLLAYDPDLADDVLAQPLAQVTATTPATPDELREVLAATRSAGYAITTSDREEGASGLSAPVFNPGAEIVGAVTLSGPSMRMSQERCEEWVELLVSSAEHLTRLLGGRLPGEPATPRP